ncbi:hypothetical protein Lal_00047424 [Lupinus albus]|nr:hypothetical protein Lal_00047424 [Lupinus albus]
MQKRKPAGYSDRQMVLLMVSFTLSVRNNPFRTYTDTSPHRILSWVYCKHLKVNKRRSLGANCQRFFTALSGCWKVHGILAP